MTVNAAVLEAMMMALVGEGAELTNDDLLEMVAIDLVLLMTIAGIVVLVRVSARDARRDMHA